MGNNIDNAEMELAWRYVTETGVSVFLTGNAGTGKTTFLRRLREATPKRMVVLAPTGVAAINAGGQTIHSFFQLPFGPYIPGMTSSEGRKSFKMSQTKKDIISTLDLLVIDEVSMVRADLLDQVDDALRRYRDRTKPFGGVQLLLIGDLMQLSPVAADDEWRLLSAHYDTPYFFSSRALSQTPYVSIELKCVYRQQDQRFISLLGAVRRGQMTAEVVNSLNERYRPGFSARDDGWIRLTTHNRAVNEYNQSRLEALPGPTEIKRAVIQDDFPEISYPTDEVLELKIGAQVMFVKNDPEHKYFNGKIGKITCFTEKGVEVTCSGSEVIQVTPVTWENTKYTIDPESKEITEQVEGTFTQYPLRLAWAITVHKSQGLTFDHAVLDINASFAHGQVYVALSRCRSLEGLVLTSPLSPRAVITDTTVNHFIAAAQESMSANAAMLPRYRHAYLLSLLDDLYSFQKIDEAYRWLERVVDEHLSARNRGLLQRLRDFNEPWEEQVTRVAARFRAQYINYMAKTYGEIANSPLLDRVKASAGYFVEKLAELFMPLLRDAVIIIDNKSVAETYNNALKALKTHVNAKRKIFDALRDEPFTIANYLNLRAKGSIDAATSTKAKASRKHAAKAGAKEEKPKYQKGDTMLATLELYRRGLNIEEMAKERGLTTATITKHILTLLDSHEIDLDQLVPPAHQRMIRRARQGFTSSFSAQELMAALPPSIPRHEITLTLAFPDHGTA